MNISTNNLEIPKITNNLPKNQFLNLFFYEYASLNNLSFDSLFISQEKLSLKLNSIHDSNFAFQIVDTITLINKKNRLVSLGNYSLGKEYSIKIAESFFTIFQSANSISGKITLEFDKSRNLFYISNFEKWSFNISLEEYSKNINFSDILNAIGYDNNKLLFREKISILARLLPFVEKNINILEITKPQVGKSYIYDELLTEKSIVKKVNDLTPANLFYNLKDHDEPSILKTYPILCIDEFHKGNLKEIIAGLQTFMENGKVSRGTKSYSSDTSIIMFANLEKNISKKIFINPKEFNPFKKIEYIDEAFLERINYFNSSFGMRKLNDSMFLNKDSKKIPISLLDQKFSELRDIDINFNILYPNLKVFNTNKEVSTRISSSILKTASGFLKILFPQIALNFKNIPLENELIFSCIQICFYLAMEGKAFSENIYENSNNFYINFFDNNLLYLNNNFFYSKIVSFFLNKENIISTFPHKTLFLNPDNSNTTIPLDVFGIEENIQEIQNLNLLQLGGNINSNYELISNQKIFANQYCQIYHQISNSWIPLFFYKEPLKNYLYGYSFTPNNINLPDLIFTNVLGNCTLTQNIICPKCGKNIYFSYIFFLVIHIMPCCKETLFYYDLFPNFFEDSKL